jgi:two-component system, chemotaxis family, protein-glutamate methylesterase/glutaminase
MDAFEIPCSPVPRLVVIAASAGSLRALMELLARLPPQLPAAIALVQHRGPGNTEQLIELLARNTRLQVRTAHDGEAFEAGTVYVCPPGVHMRTQPCVQLVAGPRVRFVRPNADLMLDSAAQIYGAGAIGIVLSGCGEDGALGSIAIANHEGTVLAQDLSTCEFAGMPKAAQRVGAVDQMLTPAQIADELQRLLGVPPATPLDADDRRVSILVAEDHAIVLEGLSVLLELEKGLAVVGRAQDGVTAVRAAAALAPDVIVMDVRMPGMDGAEATRAILTAAPDTRVIALSAETDSYSVRRMLSAGACGYLPKRRAFSELVQAIRAVIAGKPYLSPEIAVQLASGDIGTAVTRPRPLERRSS